MTFFLYFTLFSFPCPLVRTKFPSRVMNLLLAREQKKSLQICAVSASTGYLMRDTL